MVSKRVLKNSFVISSFIALSGIEGFRIIIDNSGFDKNLLLFRDVAANFFALHPLNFLFWLFSKKAKLWEILIIPVAITIGLTIYELIQHLLPFQTFDLNDIFASIISMPLCIFLNYIIVKTSK